MDYVLSTLSNLLHQTAFFNLTWGNYLMILVALVFLYLAIAKEYEPLLLVPISFGMLLVNIYPDIMAAPTDGQAGGLLHYFYVLDEWSILPSIIFMGVGAMTDFGPLIANPKSFLLGAAAQFGIYIAYFMAILLGFNDRAAAARGRPDFDLPLLEAWRDPVHGPDRRGGLFLHVAGADHPAAHHEASDNGKRTEDQNGTAASRFKAGAHPFPGHRDDRGLPDPADHSTACRYADAGQPLQGVRRREAAQ